MLQKSEIIVLKKSYTRECPKIISFVNTKLQIQDVHTLILLFCGKSI